MAAADSSLGTAACKLAALSILASCHHVDACLMRHVHVEGVDASSVARAATEVSARQPPRLIVSKDEVSESVGFRAPEGTSAADVVVYVENRRLVLESLWFNHVPGVAAVSATDRFQMSIYRELLARIPRLPPQSSLQRWYSERGEDHGPEYPVFGSCGN